MGIVQSKTPLHTGLRVLFLLFFLAFCFLWIYPFLWLVSASFKSEMAVFQETLNLIPSNVQAENYRIAWVDGNFSRYLFNSIAVTAGTLILALARTSMGGYVFGRYRFPGKTLLLGILIATFVVPRGYVIIPIVEISQQLGTLNSLFGVVLVLGGTMQAPNLLLFMGYFAKIPKELEESAKMDGAGFSTIFFRINLPLAQPMIATVSVLVFLYAWNAFFVPLVFTFSRPNLRTLAVGMMAFQGTHETNWAAMSAASIISLLPVLAFFFIMQRYIVQGFAGAVKG